jgi:hypothetical protein
MSDELIGSGPSRSLVAVVRRAAPRLTWLALLLVLTVLVRKIDWAEEVLVVLLVFSLPWRWSWWTRVLTGRTPIVQGWLSQRGTGSWQVLLDTAGSRPIQVTKEIREATGADLQRAKDVVDGVPRLVAGDLSEDAARALVS